MSGLHPALAAARGRYRYPDWEVIAAASRAGGALAAAHPGDDPRATALRTAGLLLHRGLLFRRPDRIPFRVAARAPRLSPEHLAELEALGGAVDRLLRAVATTLPGSPWLRRRLGFPVLPQEEQLLGWSSRRPLAFFRLDLTPDADGALRLIEIQAVSGGLGITQALREVYGPHPALPGLARGLGEGLFLAHREFCAAARRLPPERPVFGLLAHADSDFRHELLVLSSALSEVELVIGPLAKERGAPIPSLPDGRVPDALLRGLQSSVFFALASPYTDLLVSGVARARVCVENPWIDALDDKRLLAVVHAAEAERELGAALLPGDLARLRRAVPETRTLDAEAAASLRGRPRRERGVYLKKARSTMSRGLVDGQQINGGAFEQALDRAVAEGDWVAQRAVRGAPWPFVFVDPESGALGEMDGYVRLSPVYTRTAGGGVRLADVAITARPQRSRVHGASDACVVVPVG